MSVHLAVLPQAVPRNTGHTKGVNGKAAGIFCVSRHADVLQPVVRSRRILIRLFYAPRLRHDIIPSPVSPGR